MLKEESMPNEIARVVSKWTGASDQADRSEVEKKLLHMEERLHQRVMVRKTRSMP